MAALGVIDDPLFMAHRAESVHPECPERLSAARRALDSAVLPSRPRVLAARDASDEELTRVHGERYVTELGRTAGTIGYWDEDTYFSPDSAAAARRAAGAAVLLADELVSGRL